ncbi:MAG TPA: hypothetical protein VIY51_15685 [Xanthobacteraceae bacterium]
MSTLLQTLGARSKYGARLRALARRFLILAAVPSVLAVGGCSAALVQRNVVAYAPPAPPPVHRRAEPNARKLRALLSPQSSPDCEFKGADADGLDADLLTRLKLDYERHCYQHAEAIVRNRLRQLQVSGLCEIAPIRHRERFVRIAPSF